MSIFSYFKKGYLFQITILAVILRIILDFPKIKTIYLELDDEKAPKTIKAFLDCLQLTVGINL